MKEESSTKSRIMRQALYLFAKNGYAGTSVRDICQQAAVNVASISYHFGCKEKLFLSIVESFAGPNIAAMTQMLRPVTTYGEFMLVLRQAAEMHFNQLYQQRDLLRLILSAAESGDKAVRETLTQFVKPWHEALASWTKRSQEDGIISSEVDATIVVGMLFNNITLLVQTSQMVEATISFDVTKAEHRQYLLEQSLAIIGRALKPS